MIRLSGSSLWRAEYCPASVVLPATEERHDDQDRGVAHHAMLEEKAPEGSLVEVAFAYDVESETAREIGRCIGRNYGALGPTEIPGATDLVTLGADHLVVTDYKTGVGYMVAHPSVNLQLQFYALCACLVYGKTSAIVEVQYEDTGEVAHAEFDAFAFIEIKARIRAIWEATRAASPRVVEGEHCWRCPAAARCPAKVALALAVASGELPADVAQMELTPAVVAAGWPKIRRLEHLLEKVKESYKAVASAQPVPLGGGRFLGVVNGHRETLDGWTTFAAIKDAYGEQVATKVVEVKASKAALERALAPLAPARGKGKFVAQAVELVRAAGGIKTEPTMSVTEYGK